MKRNTIKLEQENICRFVTICYQVIGKINGKYKRTRANTVNGLQIKNRVYLIDGNYKLVNGKGVTIKNKFNIIPEWATEDLVIKYKRFLEQ